MKAAFIREFGGPETLEFGELPDPEPKAGEALIRVRACALNHLDLWVRGGLPAYKLSLPHVLGSDIAGEVVALGPGTEDCGVPIGAKVMVSPGVSCWKCRCCEEGRDNLCERYGILGADGGWGGYAELATVPARGLVPLPRPEMSFAEAAAIPLTFLTSWHMLNTLAGAGPGKTVLVVGAGSGVGVAAIQIAKALGAEVLAASTSEEKLAAAVSLGASETILLPNESLSKKARKATGGRGVDIVFEHVGAPVFKDAMRALAPGGTLVTCGATAGPTVELDLRPVFFLERGVLGAKMGTLEEFKTLGHLFRQGKLKPVVDRTFPLSEARQAHEHLAERKQFGKVVLRV